MKSSFFKNNLLTNPIGWAEAGVGKTITYISLNVLSVFVGIILMRLYLNVGAWLIICIFAIILPMGYLWVIRSLLRELKNQQEKSISIPSKVVQDNSVTVTPTKPIEDKGKAGNNFLRSFVL